MQIVPAEERINSYALVSYIPDPLGAYLDELRRDLVLGCVARSHVTVLPPRELKVDPKSAIKKLDASLNGHPSFRVELTEIQVFAGTSVIYLQVGEGAAELMHLHDALNQGGLKYDEPHVYHPHVTLAQEFDPAEVPELLATARRRWAEFRHERGFEVQTLTFVQNTAGNRWQDLKEYPLALAVEMQEPG